MTVTKKNNTLAHFDERAAYWNQLYERPQFQDRLSLFVNGIKNNVAPQSKVLDYGCGTGRIAIKLASCGYQVDAVDGSHEMIEKGRLEAENLGLSSISFEAIEPTTWLPRQQYDAIVCSSVLEYVPDDTSLLTCFSQALVPGGTLLISIPYAYSLTGIAEDMLRSNLSLIAKGQRDVQFAHRRYTRSAFSQTLKEIGFGQPQWTSFELPIFNQVGVHLSRIPLLGVMMLANTRLSNTASPPF